jgi:site-specific DNA-methyltransferase (adenine-specific)
MSHTASVTPCRSDTERHLELVQPDSDSATIADQMSGLFYCGDNLEVLSELNLVPAESVDLVYLDPPFNSQRTYNIVYKDSRAQTEAFKDHWSWEEAAPAYARLLDAGDTPAKLRTLLRGLQDLLIDEDADLLAYLAMMAPRLFALHRVLKPTGTLYLHCDTTASHYLKLVLDAVFGSSNFRNEISWLRSQPKSHTTVNFPNCRDVLLRYSRSDRVTFNKVFGEHDPDYLTKFYRFTDAAGRRYRLGDITNPNKNRPNLTYEFLGVTRVWRWTKDRMLAAHAAGRIYQAKPGAVPQEMRYLDEMDGQPISDNWNDIEHLHASDAEALGFPTQKPVELLSRVIAASSNPGDLVLDPFCGCGTTIEACERLGRRWIGIDIAAKAVEITEERFGKLGIPAPEIEWYPPDRDAAEALMKREGGGKKFETWMLRKIRAVRSRKRDRGIDGEAFFKQDGKVTHVIVSVKGGKLNPSMVRELRGTIERERAPIGVLATLHEPSKEMLREATQAGYLTIDGQQIARLQILTVDEIFKGQGIVAPGHNVTEMPKPVVPEGMPQHQEQLSLRLEPPKPIAKPSKRNEAVSAANAARKSDPAPSERAKANAKSPGAKGRK